MGMMPGLGKMKEQIAAAGLNDHLLNRQLAIISSMTFAERANPEILKHSRKQRIAKGSGTSAADINKLLKMHRQMADMMKAMGGKGKGGLMGKMLGGLGSKLGFGAGGVPGNMPNLSGIDPAQLSALQKQIKNGNLGEKLPGLPQSGLPFPGFPSGLSGNGGKLPPLPKKKS
ncbi:signal recognition particle subunit SRP54 [Bartonella schoenbuchensis R1]|nr:signal recognition particle subunit SRP54 [Bartonella schoenbuchensis R1]